MTPFDMAAQVTRETLLQLHAFDIRVNNYYVRAMREPMPEAPEGVHPGVTDRLFVIVQEFKQAAPLARGTEFEMDGKNYQVEDVQADSYGGARIDVRQR